MRDHGWRNPFIAIVMAIAAGLASPVVAQDRTPDRTPDRTLAFDLPAQDLAEALTQWSRQAGAQVFYPADGAAGQRSPAIRGRMSTREALGRLISAAPLEVARDDGRVVALRLGGREAPVVAMVEDVVVTARAGVNDWTRLDTSYAVTVVGAEQLRLRNPTGVADALKSVPGFWVEASGGEASANIRARGIPREGFSTVSLQEDGLPIQHDPGLGYLNADQSFRLDETIQRMEVVRGGPSSIFASYAPGGTINFLTRRGGETFEGVAKAQVGDYGYSRGDVWMGGPAGDWRFGVGGFYRQSQGRRDQGFMADHGGQIRVSLGRDFQRGSLDMNIKHLDDNVTLQTGVPLRFDLDAAGPSGVIGFDALAAALTGPETRLMTLRRADGPFDWDLGRGTDVRLTQYTALLRYAPDHAWVIENRLRVRLSDTHRFGLFPNTPTTATQRLDQYRAAYLASVPGARDLRLRYAVSGEAFDAAGQNGNGLVVDGSLRWVHAPLDEIINDTRLMRTLRIGAQSHDLALGVYAARIKERFERYSVNVLLDVRENARRLDVVAVDALGQPLRTLTENGVTRYGAEFANGRGEATTLAVYLSDEWAITPAFRLDAGLRWETVGFKGRSEGAETIDLGQTPSIADDAFVTGSGVFTPLDRTFRHSAWTLGADWRFAERMGVFARHTSTYLLPSLGDFIYNAANTAPFVQEMSLSELGYKWSGVAVELYATAFLTEYDALAFNGLQFDPALGGYVVQTSVTGTRTVGLEIEGRWAPSDRFDLGFNATFQNPVFGDYIYYEAIGGALVRRDLSGNQINRTPRTMLRLIPGVNLMDGRLRLEADYQHYGRRFSDAANLVALPAYDLVNLSVRYDLTERISLHVHGDNLFNALGLTEGNPRSGQIIGGEAGAVYGIGRPEFIRSFRAAVLYRF